MELSCYLYPLFTRISTWLGWTEDWGWADLPHLLVVQHLCAGQHHTGAIPGTVHCTVQSLGINFMKFCTIGKGVIKILLSNFFYTWPLDQASFGNIATTIYCMRKQQSWTIEQEEIENIIIINSTCHQICSTQIFRIHFIQYDGPFSDCIVENLAKMVLNHHIKTTL